MDFRGRRVMIGLSGGINSMALLCWLSKYEYKPEDIWLFYAHFEEHSPDTLKFVEAGIAYAKKHFRLVGEKITYNSVLRFFDEQKMIPHPMLAPCTRLLKILPAKEFATTHNIEIDLVGYVESEKRRANKSKSDLFLEKQFPILDKSNEWCFEIVQKEIGWYPEIYDIKNENGKRLFTHNNCLPCKNMNTKDFARVREYFPAYWSKAMDLSDKLKRHWGRKEAEFYTEFGRDNTGNEQPCELCRLD